MSDHAGPDGPAMLVFRPRRLRVLAGVMSIALCVLVLIGWYALPSSLREQFTLSQILTLLALLAFLVLTMLALASSSVRADQTQLRVRNGLRRHVIPYSRVHKVLLRPGDPWATVLLKPSDGTSFEADLDAEKRSLMGIQANDGALAARALDALRQRLQQTPPPR